MRDFSQLLDDLVYTRSRNAKLKLIGDYLQEHARSRTAAMALAALTGELDLPAVKARGDPRDRRGAGRSRAALHEPRLCRRHGRDGCPALAQVGDQRAEADDGTSAHRPSGRAASLAPPRRCAARARLDARSSRRQRAASRFSSSRPARFAIGISARLAKQALARGVRARRRFGRGSLARHRRRRSPSCSTGQKDAAPQPIARDVPVFRPFMLAHPLETTRVSLEDYAAEWKWDGIRVQLVHAGGETRLYSRDRRRHLAQLPRRGGRISNAGRARRRAIGRGSDQGLADEHGGAAASFNALQQRLGRKTVSQKMLGAYPAFVRLYDILFEGDVDLRDLAWESGARGSSLRRRARPRPLRPLAADRGREFRGARRPPRQRARRLDRGHHAEAPRQPLCRRPPHGPLVQMEARSAHRRLRADVRAARHRESDRSTIRDYTFGCWSEERRAAARSARPISASPTRN